MSVLLPLLTPQQETILRMLIRGGPVSVSRISWVVWGINPNGPPKSASKAIRVQIHYMRKALEPHGVTIRTCRGDGYMIDPKQHRLARALINDMPLVRDRRQFRCRAA